MRLRLLLAAVLSVLSAFVVTPGAASAASNQTVFFEAPRDLTAATSTDETRAKAFEDLDHLGVRALRVNLRWYDVAPERDGRAKPAFDATDPNAYAWANYAKTIDEARRRGWTVLISPSSPVPVWATAAKADTVTRPSASEFQLFAEAVAKRFGSANTMYSIWNEPNLPRFLLPQVSGGKVVSPGIYRELFVAGRRGIRVAQPGAKVLFGELAPVGGSRDGRQYPLTFMRRALCLSTKYKFDRKRCSKLRLDGVAHHPYQFTNGKLNRNDVTYRTLSRLVTMLDRAAKAKAITSKTPVYYTEFGIQSTPDKFLGVSTQRQVEIRARVERNAYYTSRIKGFSQYLLTDDDDLGGFQTGLRFAANGREKRSYEGFRLVLDAKPISKGRVSIWGLVRPAEGRTTIVIERRLKGSKRFRTWKKVRTNSRGAFNVRDKNRSGARYRYRWTAPEGKVRSPYVRIYRG